VKIWDISVCNWCGEIIKPNEDTGVTYNGVAVNLCSECWWVWRDGTEAEKETASRVYHDTMKSHGKTHCSFTPFGGPTPDEWATWNRGEKVPAMKAFRGRTGKSLKDTVAAFGGLGCQ
jgi:hypothetical protein